MRSDISASDLIGSENIATAFAFASFESTSFTEQVLYLRLDPTSDFRHADLSYVDLSFADLRGFDFTGANLCGATGRNVQWDSSTILQDAAITSSIFSYEASKAEFYKTDPEAQNLVRRLAKEHYSVAILAIANLLTGKTWGLRSTAIAKALFSETMDLNARSNILYFLKASSQTAEEHKAFIFYAFAKFGGEPFVIKSALRTLALMYYNDEDAFTALLSYVDDQNNDVALEAFSGAIKSTFAMKHVGKFLEVANRRQMPMMRRALVQGISKRLPADYALTCYDWRLNNYLDYEEPISRRRLEQLAHDSIERSPEARPIGKAFFENPAVKDSRSEFEIRARFIRHALEVIARKYAVPFRFQ